MSTFLILSFWYHTFILVRHVFSLLFYSLPNAQSIQNSWSNILHKGLFKVTLNDHITLPWIFSTLHILLILFGTSNLIPPFLVCNFSWTLNSITLQHSTLSNLSPLSNLLNLTPYIMCLICLFLTHLTPKLFTEFQLIAFIFVLLMNNTSFTNNIQLGTLFLISTLKLSSAS